MSDVLTQDKPGIAVIRYRNALVWLLLFANCVYFAWRARVINPDAPLLSWLFFIFEFVCAAWGFYCILRMVRLSHRIKIIAPIGLSVDVFITTYNEPISLVRCTLIAAIAIRYPHKTWLLDDGARPEMQLLANELGCCYLSRYINRDAKAGNLNHGLSYAAGDFILVLDADHIALPEFLDDTLGYFADKKVAFVQTPQEYYNFNSFQHFGANRSTSASNEHSLFNRIIQRERDLVNATMFAGSGAVLRRLALDDIGGFATGTVTEDMHTSVRLHARGWHSVFHPKTLSGGLAPADARSFRRQRLRWAQGAVQVFFQEKLLVNWSLCCDQRIAYLSHVIEHFTGWKTIFIAFFPSYVLMTGVSPLRVGIAAYLMFVVPYFLINWLVFEELTRKHSHFFRNEIHNLARCVPLIAAVFAAYRKRIPFFVTPKVPQAWDAHIMVFPLLVIIIGVSGLFVGWQKAATAVYTWPEITIMSFWVIYALVSAVTVLGISWRCHAQSGVEPLFPATLLVNLRNAGNENVTYLIETTGLAIDRAVLCCCNCTGIVSGSQVSVSFTLNQCLWVLNGMVSSIKNDKVEIQWKFESHYHAAEYAVAVVLHRLYYLASFDRIDHKIRLPIPYFFR